MRVDSHTHVFSRHLPMVAARRYTPHYDATLQDLFAHLDNNHLDRAVLVQPSFLGADNRYLLTAISQAPDRLRGIAIVESETTEEQFDELLVGGVVGVRFNLVGAPMPDTRSIGWTTLLRRILARGWHVELHREAFDLCPLIESMLEAGAKVVVDHYGRPDPTLGLADANLHTLATFASSRRVWVKLSAAYRCTANPASFERDAAVFFANSFGTDRLLWGSDWPHTQCETSAAVQASLRALDILQAREALDAVLGGNAASVYGFSQPAPTTNAACSLVASSFSE